MNTNIIYFSVLDSGVSSWPSLLLFSRIFFPTQLERESERYPGCTFPAALTHQFNISIHSERDSLLSYFTTCIAMYLFHAVDPRWTSASIALTVVVVLILTASIAFSICWLMLNKKNSSALNNQQTSANKNMENGMYSSYPLLYF